MVLYKSKQFTAFLVSFIIHLTCLAQPVNVLSDSAQQRLQHILVLPDKGYTFSQVLADSTLPFTAANTLKYNEGGIYWIKLVVDNRSKYAGKYSLYTQPFLDNTVFYYDQDAGKWIENRTGALSPVRARRFGIAPCIIQGGARNIIYVRVDIASLGKFNNFVNARFVLEKEAVTRQQEQLTWIICIATIVVVLLFLLYNAIVFSSIRDRTYLYYMLVQAGGIVYVAGTFRCFTYLIPWRNFHSWLSPGGSVYFSQLNMFIMRLSTVVIITSYVQLTRHYLKTRLHLPRLDAVLKWATAVWILFELVHSTITFSGWKFLDFSILLYSNISILILIVLILITAIAARLRRVYAAKYFLWANTGALGFMLALAVYYIFAPDGSINVWLPCAAIIMQALMFSMALVARLRLAREELAEKQQEAEQLKTDIEQLAQEQQQLTAEHKQIEEAIHHEKNRNEALEEQLAANNRQLASATLYMTQKNELLAQLKGQVRDLGRLLPHGSKALQHIEANLQNSQFLGSDWEKFKLHFEQVHPRFFEELKAKHPGLTQNETRLCAYFHMNLSTKEIAGLLNIDPASVRRAKTRLNKKMNGALAGSSE